MQHEIYCLNYNSKLIVTNNFLYKLYVIVANIGLW